MGPKRLENIYITLQHSQISWPKELNRNYGLVYKNRTELRYIGKSLNSSVSIIPMKLILIYKCTVVIFLNN